MGIKEKYSIGKEDDGGTYLIYSYRKALGGDGFCAWTRPTENSGPNLNLKRTKAVDGKR